jgi:hypothetical protein
MLFENKTGNPVKVRVLKNKEQKLYDWITVRPDKTVKLPEAYGRAMGLTSIETPEEPKDDKAPKGKKGKDKVPKGDPLDNQPKAEEPPKGEVPYDDSEYKARLLNLHGVGEKTVEDVISEYPTEHSLKAAIKKETHLPFDDDVVELLMKEFGE